VRYAWLLREDYPKDKHIRELTNDILRELVVEHNVEVSDYFKKPREVLVEEMEIVEDEDMSELSKYEKIKRKKAVDNVQGDENFIGYAFVELFKTDDFEDTFEDIMDEIEDELRESEKKLNKADAKKKRKAEEKLARIEKNRGKALGIDKIVIVDPYYIKVDERKADAIQYGDTEAKMLEYSEKLKMNAAMLDLNIEILDSKDFQIDDADKFNDFSLLNDWVGESLDHEDDLDEERNMIISDKAYVNKLIKKYDTKYFMWTGVISVHERKSLSYYYACVALMGIITIPFTIYYLVIPEYSTYLYTVVYNIETGEKVLIERDLIRKKDRKDILNSRIYDTLFQIKSKRENIK
ncbi:MAG: hypothetical protein IIA45_05065, partial [Bacteroidetes bacterium]|nr:hypothetical protein [Bacteroidota bacterium]